MKQLNSWNPILPSGQGLFSCGLGFFVSYISSPLLAPTFPTSDTHECVLGYVCVFEIL